MNVVFFLLPLLYLIFLCGPFWGQPFPFNLFWRYEWNDSKFGYYFWIPHGTILGSQNNKCFEIGKRNKQKTFACLSKKNPLLLFEVINYLYIIIFNCHCWVCQNSPRFFMQPATRLLQSAAVYPELSRVFTGVFVRAWRGYRQRWGYRENARGKIFGDEKHEGTKRNFFWSNLCCCLWVVGWCWLFASCWLFVCFLLVVCFFLLLLVVVVVVVVVVGVTSQTKSPRWWECSSGLDHGRYGMKNQQPDMEITGIIKLPGGSNNANLW